MSPTQDPMVHRRRLRVELRRLRDQAGFTQRQVAEAMDWSLSKLIRIESGMVGLSTTDLRALLQHYGIADASEVERYVQMGRASKEQQGWWTAYRDVASPQYLTYLGYENAASAFQVFQPLAIPGLLQDEEYAQAVIQASTRSASSEQVNELVALRMRRQDELFERPDPPDMLFVLDEAVLHRQVGGRDVMRRQLQRLRRDAERKNVSIEVVPFSAGAHAGMSGSFVILEFADYADDVLYVETAKGNVVNRDDKGEIDEFRRVLGSIRLAAGNVDLGTLIDAALDRLSK